MNRLSLPVIVYELNGDDRISAVGDDWAEFAAANDAPELTPGNVLGKSIYDFIAGPEVKELYRMLLRRVREIDEPLMYPFRCDGPAVRRHMTMHIRARAHRFVDITCITNRVEPRDPVPLLDRNARRTRLPVPLCSSCNRVRLGISQWAEADEAVRQLQWFDLDDQPALTHTVCDRCLSEKYGMLP